LETRAVLAAIRARDYMALLEESTHDGRSRVR